MTIGQDLVDFVLSWYCSQTTSREFIMSAILTQLFISSCTWCRSRGTLTPDWLSLVTVIIKNLDPLWKNKILAEGTERIEDKYC